MSSSLSLLLLLLLLALSGSTCRCCCNAARHNVVEVGGDGAAAAEIEIDAGTGPVSSSSNVPKDQDNDVDQQQQQVEKKKITKNDEFEFHQQWKRELWKNNDSKSNNSNQTIEDMWFNLECDYLYQRGTSTERTVPTPNDFQNAIRLYNALIKESSDDGEYDDYDGTRYLKEDGYNTFQIPVEVRNTPGKGRGIFALVDIPQHTIIRQNGGPGRDVWFEEGQLYRDFVLGLKSTEFACDVLQWAYPYNSNGEGLMMVDLDISCMLNDGGYEFGNMGCPPRIAKVMSDAAAAAQTTEPTKDQEAEEVDAEEDNEQHEFDCFHYEYALRDIQAGEEILIIYEGFDYLEAYGELGLE